VPIGIPMPAIYSEIIKDAVGFARPRATTMSAIGAAARLDSDWLSRGMSYPASLREHAHRYRELKRGRDHVGAAYLRRLSGPTAGIPGASPPRRTYPIPDLEFLARD